MALICIEGPNGAGKTSTITKLKQKGFDTLSSPNGTPLAKYLRAACRGTGEWSDLSNVTKFLLFSAARLDEYNKLAKDKGPNEFVICDRWHFSTYVYQCTFEDIPVEFLEHTIHKDEMVRLVIILTGESDILVDRMEKDRKKNPQHGKCSWTQNLETMKKINEIYINELPKYLITKNIPFVIIDTTNKNQDQVQSEVEKIIENLKTV